MCVQQERLTAAEAMAHRYFDTVRDPDGSEMAESEDWSDMLG